MDYTRIDPQVLKRAAQMIKALRESVEPTASPANKMAQIINISQGEWAEAVLWAEAIRQAHNPTVSIVTGAQRILDLVEAEQKSP